MAVGSAFVAGLAVASASDRETQAPSNETEIVGPGFLPATGWDVVQTGATGPPQAPTATAANIALDRRDPAGELPQRTLSRLNDDDVVLFAVFYPVGESEAVDSQFPTGRLPLRLADAEPGGIEGQPDDVSAKRLLAQVGGYNIDVLVFFGASSPSVGTRDAADEQLGRLVAPGCPIGALPVSEEDLDDAERFILEWLPSHYQQEQPDDLEGATAEAALAPDAPRGEAARIACGEEIWERTIEVDVVLPRVAEYSASLSQLSYFVAKMSESWEVWYQIH
jgi:hypothetical protein